MNFKTVVKHFGTQVKTARALGMTQGSVASWKRAGIPVQRQMQIEVVTGGKLRAVLPRAWRPRKGAV